MCHMLHNALPSGHSSTVYRTHTARAYQYLVNPNIIRHSTFRDDFILGFIITILKYVVYRNERAE